MKHFASSGSCFAKEKIIKGTVKGITFKSNEFTGVMDSQIFWDKLATYAKEENVFIVLSY